MIKVSIIIPVYNVEKYLRQCLDSVVLQTLKDIEIICINDGSTDSSFDILKEYEEKDKRIIIINKENEGLSAARNLGILKARGEYIGFVDSDDWLELDFYEKLYNAAKKYQADIACTNIRRVYEDFSECLYMKCDKYRSFAKLRKKYKLAQLPENCYVMNRIYERIKLQKSKLQFENGVTFEDIVFSHKVIYFLGKLVTVPDTNYYYRDNPYSIVNIRSEKRIADYKNAIAKALKFLQENNVRISNLSAYHYELKKSYSFVGLPILAVKKYGDTVRYCLFGKFPVFESKTIYYNAKCKLYDKRENLKTVLEQPV